MRNLTMLTDFYQLTMMQGYFLKDNHNDIAVFDMFYRKNPDENSFSIFCGVEEVGEYIKNLSFSKEDLEYLKSYGIFEDAFLNYLETFKFTGEIYTFLEGSVIFPYEPLVRVKAPILQCQLIETTVLNILNHQSLIATKSQRVATAAKDIPVLEFGLRRAQGPDAGLYGSRAAFIGGCVGTSNVLAGKTFDIPVSGTHAHAWVMSFDSELEAFMTYGELYNDNCILLVDTYDTLTQGLPNAIKTFDSLKEQGKLPVKYGIRLDSGDLAYLSKKCRTILDEAGYPEALISASNDLDEYLIRDLDLQDAKIDLYGVGTNLITSKKTPAFGGVYKISALQDKTGAFHSKIKLSNNPEKVTNPGIKKVFRLYSVKSGKIIADLIALEHEKINTKQDLTIFDPVSPWKKKTLKANEYTAREMLTPLFINGEFVGKELSTREIKEYCNAEKATLWEENKRTINPQTVHVDLSDELYNLKKKIIRESLDK